MTIEATTKRATIELRCIDAASLIEGMASESVDFVHADPPWLYSDGGADGAGLRGLAKTKYDGLKEADIAAHLASTVRLVGENAYMVVWCTFPKLAEWLRHDAAVEGSGWHYVTGASWGKTNKIGVGTHFRGDAELILLYKKGSPKPLTTQSNLILAPRLGHSEKPQKALRALVALCCPKGGCVLDLYAGSTASLMRACRATDRSYLGAEISQKRYAEALRRFGLLEQQPMEMAFGLPSIGVAV